jgi:hypothetical protein
MKYLVASTLLAGCSSASLPAQAPLPPASGTAQTTAPFQSYVRSCTASDLGASSWESNDEAGDTNFGWIAVRDRSATACALGTLHLVAMRRSGRTFGPATTDAVTHQLILSANASPLRAGVLPPPTERVVLVLVASSDSEPNGTSCQDRTSPTSIRIEFPEESGHLDVIDRRQHPHTLGITICKGNSLEPGRVGKNP